jgi:hypothetical protein
MDSLKHKEVNTVMRTAAGLVSYCTAVVTIIYRRRVQRSIGGNDIVQTESATEHGMY